MTSPSPLRQAYLLATLLAFLRLASVGAAQEIAGITPPGGPVVTMLRDGFTFTEGPALHPDGSVYFTDLPSETILVWTPDGQLRTHREQSGRANGLAFDASGRLLACEMANGKVTACDANGGKADLATTFQGKPFNQTNDLALDAKGGIYFTDPYYGPERSLPQDRMAVYYIKPGGESVERVVDKGPEKPNGVLLSPDGKFLYVIDSENPTLWVYAVGDMGQLTPAGAEGSGKFADLKLPEGQTKGGGDGGAIDSAGNLFIASGLGIQVFAPDGKALGIIPVPQQPANCAFFGPERKRLFITARTAIYAVDLLIPGAPQPPVPPAAPPAVSAPPAPASATSP